MTKKDYVDIAAAIRKGFDVKGSKEWASWAVLSFNDGQRAALTAVVDALCVTLHADNPRFNADTFKDAVGLDALTPQPFDDSEYDAETERGN